MNPSERDRLSSDLGDINPRQITGCPLQVILKNKQNYKKQQQQKSKEIQEKCLFSHYGFSSASERNLPVTNFFQTAPVVAHALLVLNLVCGLGDPVLDKISKRHGS